MNIFHEQFSSGQVAEASGATKVQIQTWLTRGLFVGFKGGSKPGDYRTFSFHSVMQVAIATKMIELGMKPTPAFEQAMFFAHGGEVAQDGNPERVPGVPYDPHEGRTLFVVSPVRSVEILLKEDDSALEFWALVWHHTGREGAHIIVNLNPLFESVCWALGHDPAEVYRLAYGEAD